MTKKDVGVLQEDSKGNVETEEVTAEETTVETQEETVIPRKEKLKVVTILTFAVVCLIVAIGVYINDYGYTDFLPGSEIDGSSTLIVDKK